MRNDSVKLKGAFFLTCNSLHYICNFVRFRRCADWLLSTEPRGRQVTGRRHAGIDSTVLSVAEKLLLSLGFLRITRCNSLRMGH